MISSEHKVGPRAKCDRVVYEAIAKAAEIIVRGRCRCNNSTQHNNVSGSVANNNNTANNSPNTSHTGTRFYLEIEEVPTVRSILQMWKRSLHVPLRLDVYYEYCTDPTNPEQTTRKELLERWCIDYLPSHEHGHNTHASGHGHLSPRHNADETISQLRQVVKRVVIQLRVLFSLTRLMPAYRLHHALMDDLQHGNRNHAVSNLNRPLGSGPGLGGGYYQSTSSSTDNINQDTSYRDLVGGKINFSFYVSDTTSSDQRLTSDATLFSSSTNNPFARHDLDPISTPFGVLHLTGLFDESLNVGNVLSNRARRIMEWGKVQSRPMSVPVNSNLQGNDGNMQIRPDAHYSGNQHQQQQQYQQQQHNDSSQSRAIPIREGDTGTRTVQNNHDFVSEMSPMSAQYAENHHQHNQQHQHQHQHRSHSSEPRGKMHFLKQMSMPDPNHLGTSPNVVSEHFRRNNAANMDRPNSARPAEIRARLGSDPGRGLASKENEKRVLSGLSLAMMNEDPNPNQGCVNTEQQQQVDIAAVQSVLSATPPSPLIQPAGSGEEIASLRQRMAFHHPPPSFDEQSLPNVSSPSTNQHVPTMSAQPSSLYGYGYNNGHHVIPPSNAINVGSFGPSRNNSPSPMPVNTPPQPMFIGSQPRSFSIGGINKCSPGDHPPTSFGGISKNRQSEDDDVPFRNPTTLQQAPVDDTGVSGSGFSSKLASVQASFQMQSISNNPPPAKDSLLPPLNTLDALNSSPFKMSQSVGPLSSNGPPLSSSPGGVSIFSSLVMGKGSAAYGPLDNGFPLALASASSAMLPSRSNSEHISRSSVGFQFEKDDDYDDMPFAVDMDYSSQSSVGGGAAGGSTTKAFKHNGTIDFGASSNNSMSSQVVTSLAHRCSTAGRLKLFSNGEDQQSFHGTSTVLERSFVEDQLNEFRSFGDSITGSGLLPPMKR